MERRFGGRHRLIQDSLKRLRALQGLSSSGSAHDLREFADAVTSSLNKLRNIGDTSNIYSDTLLREVVAKLSSRDRDAFFEMCVSSEQACSLVTLEPWLQRRAEASLLSETYRKAQPTADSRRSDEAVGLTNQGPRKRTFIVKRSVGCNICKNGDHQLEKCEVFLGRDVDGRWSIVKDSKRCFSCLKRSHRSADCHQSRRCGCRRPHRPLLCAERQIGDATTPSRTAAGTLGGIQGGACNVWYCGPYRYGQSTMEEKWW